MTRVKSISYLLGMGIYLCASVAGLNTVSAAVGRIEDPRDPQNLAAAKTRCGNVPLPADKCDALRKTGVATGCVSQGEADQLSAWGLAPVCMGGGIFTGPDQYRGWCACGCFHPLTEIAVETLNGFSQSVAAQEIVDNPKGFRLKHLNSNAAFQSLNLSVADLLYTTVGPEARPLVVIETIDGRTLKVTTQHAILTASGEMVQAKALRPEDLLVDQNGKFIGISNIRTEKYDGNVVNFRLNVEKPIEHVIFAEGVAVGDQAWQSTLEDLQNQVLVRQAD